MRASRNSLGRILCVLPAVLVAACGLQPDPPPQFDSTDFAGTGKEMARCMEFASQSTCENEIWGGGEN
ncbi:MAG: hypothetical protein IPK66_16190 [Rhodospirillales bacterium]|nr:hypothetical protein [Rhodospirillales bacterium]